MSYGISSIRPNVINKFIKLSNIDVVMMQYSLLDRRPEYELLDQLNQNDISVFERGSLAKGILNDSSTQIKTIEDYLSYDTHQINQSINNINASLHQSIKHIALQFN